jgi:formiminotetrahydrofolate cyclodeaminase
MDQPTLFDLSTTELLTRFGAGNATPGSGCAAALMALLAAKLIAAVARMTVEKGKTHDVREQADVIIFALDSRICPRLKELFDEDARVFESVIVARKRRDGAIDPSEKRKYTQEASETLRQTTDVLLELVELSFQVMNHGLSIWKIGFRPAMGDAGAGISAAIAAITTCLLVANLNLRSARSTWAREAKVRWDEISSRLSGAQEQLLSLIRSSNEETNNRLLPLFNETEASS